MAFNATIIFNWLYLVVQNKIINISISIILLKYQLKFKTSINNVLHGDDAQQSEGSTKDLESWLVLAKRRDFVCGIRLPSSNDAGTDFHETEDVALCGKIRSTSCKYPF